jgi:hypothetical protein
MKPFAEGTTLGASVSRKNSLIRQASTGAVPMNSTPIVEWLTGGTDIAVAFGLISKPLGTVERAVLSVDTVAGSHIGSDAPIRQPLQELPVPVGRVGRYRFWFSSLPLREAGEHVLRGDGFLAHARRRCLHSHNLRT